MDKLKICPECGDLFPIPCSDPFACIMSEGEDRTTGGLYQAFADLVVSEWFEETTLVNEFLEMCEVGKEKAGAE